jgi:hypothetical protein
MTDESEGTSKASLVEEAREIVTAARDEDRPDIADTADAIIDSLAEAANPSTDAQSTALEVLRSELPAD